MGSFLFCVLILFIQSSSSIIVLPNSTITIDCSLPVTCDLPSWQVDGQVYSSYGLLAGVATYSILEDGGLSVNNIQSDMNGTVINCITLNSSADGAFSLTRGTVSELIVAAIPDRTQTPDYSLIPGCSALIQWIAPFDNHKSILHYSILLTENSVTSMINTTNSTPTLQLDNIIGGVAYTVSVAAINLVGEGLHSVPLVFEIPSEAPTPLCKLDSVTQTSVSFSWIVSSDAFVDFTDFQVSYDLEIYGSDTAIQLITSNSTSHTFNSLMEGTKYYVNITSSVPGYTGCVTNSICSLEAVTDTKPGSAADNLRVNVYVFYLVFLILLFVQFF